MAERIVKNITEDYLTCSICWNIYSDPKMLPCSHTFCSRCLEDYINSKPKSKDDIDCPICRHPLEVCTKSNPNEWINSLASDRVSLSILKAIGLNGEPALQTESQDGNDNAAPKEETGNIDNSQYVCARHPDKKLDVYCSKHDVVICSECAWRDHRELQCECSSAREVIEKRFNAIKCLVAQQAMDASKLLDSDDGNSKTAKSVCDDFQRSITEVEESFAEVYTLFKSRITNLRHKTSETIEKDLSISEIKRLQETITEKLNFIEDLTENNKNPNESMREISSLCSSSSELQVNIHELSEKIKSGSLMKFTEGDLNVLDAFVSSTKQNLPEECMPFDEIYKDEPNDKEYVMVTRSGKFTDFEERVEQSIEHYNQFTFSAKRPDEAQCMLSSVALIGTTAVVVVDQMNKKLKKFKIPEGQFLNELSVQFEPHQVATLRDSSNVVVSVWETPKIIIVSTDPFLEILKTIETDIEYIGVTSHVTDCVALASIQCRRVDILNVTHPMQPLAKGETIYQSSRRRSFPDRLTATATGNIIIRNRQRKEIVCFNKHNVLLWSRRLKFAVADVACFRGRVFASLREKHEIVSFREDGQGVLQYLKPKSKFRHPWGISGFKDCLAVTEDSPSDVVHVLVFNDN